MLEKYFHKYTNGTFFIKISEICSRYLSPNQITAASFVTGILSLPALYMGWCFVATVLLFLSGFFDFMDGKVARMLGIDSLKGAIYDIMSDRAVESAVIIGLLIVEPDKRGVEISLMLSSVLLCVTSFLLSGIVCEKNEHKDEKSFYYSSGIMERPEAFIMFTLMIWLPQYFTELAWTFTILVFTTTIIRVKQMISIAK